MQHHGQQAVGTVAVGEGVVLGACSCEGAVVPGKRQLALADGVVEGGAVVPKDMEVEKDGAVASVSVGKMELDRGVAGQFESCVVIGQLIFNHSVEDGCMRRVSHR